jgi:hypothetical protein
VLLLSFGLWAAMWGAVAFAGYYRRAVVTWGRTVSRTLRDYNIKNDYVQLLR